MKTKAMSEGLRSRMTAIAVAIAAMILIFAANCEPVHAAGLNVMKHSQQDIVRQLKSSGVSVRDKHTFAVTPAKNATMGELSNASKQGAVAMLNNIRYVAGVPSVTWDESHGKHAQAAAFVDWCIGKLTHHPQSDGTQPEGMPDDVWDLGEAGASSSNIASGHSTLNAAVLGWMADEDRYNIDRVGHRRWSINPKMGKVGFGASASADNSYKDRYYAEYSFDSTGTGTQTNVAWPAEHMPIEFFNDGIPWSLSTGSYVDPSGVTVQLERRASSPSGSGSWTFTNAGSYSTTSAKYFNVENSGYGQSGCIIFRPDNVSYKSGDIFDVTITGAGSETITYTVEFFNGYPVETLNFEESEQRLEYSSMTVRPAVTPLDAQGYYEVKYTSSDTSVVTVDNNGTISKVGAGVATITATIDGRYTLSGSPLSASYKVTVPQNINDEGITVECDDKLVYTGRKVTPTLSIKAGNKKLTEGIDYTVKIPDDAIKSSSYGEEVYYIEITGAGVYYGTRYQPFSIVRKDLGSCRIVITPNKAEASGNNQKPKIEVYDGTVLLNEGTDYIVSADGSGTKPGTYPVSVTAPDSSDCYEGTLSAVFTIEESAAAKRASQKGSDGTDLGAGASAEAAERAITSSKSEEGPAGSVFGVLQLKSSKQTKTSIKLNWKKVKGAKKYVVYGNACGKKNKMKKLKTLSKNTFTVKKIAKKKLKKGTYHKFIVVALDKNNNVVSTSKVIHVATKGGKVGNNKSVTTKAKKNKVTLKKGKSFKLVGKAVAASKKLKVKKHRAVCYETSNKKVATVSKKGVIKGIKKGKCKVYAYSQDGQCKIITVTVK